MEKHLERKCGGWLAFNYPSVEYIKVGHSGYPDRLLLSHSTCLWVEFKTKIGKLRKSQNSRIKTLEKKGFIVCVCKDIEDFKRVVVIQFRNYAKKN